MKYDFDTLLEGTVVSVYWEYEYDKEGIYNASVTNVLYQGVDVLPILSEETLDELDAAAFKSLMSEQPND